MMTIQELLRDELVLLDGGMGTLLQQAGLAAGEPPERYNITHPDEVCAIHRAYFDAGSHIVSTNTFGANSLKFTAAELDDIIPAAVANARRAQRETVGTQPTFVALDIGPTGKLLKPYGDLDFEDAVAIFADVVRRGVACGVDLILIETMSDSYETKAALLAAKENGDLPVFVSNAYGEDGRLTTGSSPEAMVAMLEGLGADAIGVNCSYGPDQLADVIARYLAVASVPVLLKPNAGLPQVVDGRTVYDIAPAPFAASVAAQIKAGVRIVGGCCGTTPAHIEALATAARALSPRPLTEKTAAVIASSTHTVVFGDAPILIGERINPTGKKKLKAALVAHDMPYLLSLALTQQEQGAHVLDVNVGLPEIDEASLLTEAVSEIQAICDLPLQIDTADPIAMERALRRYNGKALINSVNGKEESMRAIFPLAKKYGGMIVALTLDEEGIPATVEGRLAIARRILTVAAEYGIRRQDILFDPLAMTVSADPQAAMVTLECVRRIRDELGCHTSLGVSNVSFGLPCRDAVNSTFFAAALQHGLSAAIMNPASSAMMQVYYAHRVLHAQDENCRDYIAYAQTVPTAVTTATPTPTDTPTDGSDLKRAIMHGLRAEAESVARALLTRQDGLTIINDEVIPALDRVGIGFEEGRVYLPQLLMSAEAAGAACEVIKAAMQTAADSTRCTVVLATVHGDIHDIGKNIVKLLLENYGFDVHDLGRDVPPERIVEEATRLDAPLVALSALMTTTVPAMEETIRLLRAALPRCRVVVGGAVLTAEYAARIGADRYAKDAMETVRYADAVDSGEVFG